MAFKPKKGVAGVQKQLAFLVTDETYGLIEGFAKKNRVSMGEFVRQCVEYALANMEEE